jgi:hypothetical protein
MRVMGRTWAVSRRTYQALAQLKTRIPTLRTQVTENLVVAAKGTAKKANLRIYVHCGPPVFSSAAWTDNRDSLPSSLFKSCLSASRLLTLREDTILISSAIDSNRTVSRSSLMCFCAFQTLARSCIFFCGGRGWVTVVGVGQRSLDNFSDYFL